MNQNEIDRTKFSDYGTGRGGADDRLPDGRVRPLTAQEKEIAARRAAIHEVPVEQMNPRRQ